MHIDFQPNQYSKVFKNPPLPKKCHQFFEFEQNISENLGIYCPILGQARISLCFCQAAWLSRFRLAGWPCNASEQLSISPSVSLWGSKLWPGQLWTGLYGSGAGIARGSRGSRGSSSPRLAHGICSHRDRDTAESWTVVSRLCGGWGNFWWGRLKKPWNPPGEDSSVDNYAWTLGKL